MTELSAGASARGARRLTKSSARRRGKAGKRGCKRFAAHEQARLGLIVQRWRNRISAHGIGGGDAGARAIALRVALSRSDDGADGDDSHWQADMQAQFDIAVVRLVDEPTCTSPSQVPGSSLASGSLPRDIPEGAIAVAEPGRAAPSAKRNHNSLRPVNVVSETKVRVFLAVEIAGHGEAEKGDGDCAQAAEDEQRNRARVLRIQKIRRQRDQKGSAIEVLLRVRIRKTRAKRRDQPKTARDYVARRRHRLR